MTHEEIQDRLSDYLDGGLNPEERLEVAQHVSSCANCSETMRRLELLRNEIANLPGSIQPERDLWPNIARRLTHHDAKIIDISTSMPERERYWPSSSVWLRVAAVLVVAVGSFWLTTKNNGRAWEVARVEGEPRIDDVNLRDSGKLGVGQWLETDQTSRARLTIADIGHADIGPNSRIRLLVTKQSEQRLEMVRGHMKASVSSPPRIFIVETPSATAVDLGCSYDLYVNEVGNGTIHVTSGEVSMEFNGRESFVPTGALCETKRRIGPGTPYSDLSSEDMRQTLRLFDFENGGIRALDVILQKATAVDAITLWHLLQRVDETNRGRVFDRFATLLPPPKGVTKEGILRLDKNMLEDWLNEFAVRSFSIKRLLSMN